MLPFPSIQHVECDKIGILICSISRQFSVIYLSLLIVFSSRRILGYQSTKDPEVVMEQRKAAECPAKNRDAGSPGDDAHPSASGLCDTSSEDLNYGIVWAPGANDGRCDLCNIALTSPQHMMQHREGRKHLKKKQCQVGKRLNTTRSPPVFMNTAISSPAEAAGNVCSAPRSQNAAAASSSSKQLLPSDFTEQYWCDICHKGTNTESQLVIHKRSPAHMRRLTQRETGLGNTLDNTTWHKCEQCDKLLNSKEQLLVHKEIHLPTPPSSQQAYSPEHVDKVPTLQNRQNAYSPEQVDNVPTLQNSQKAYSPEQVDNVCHLEDSGWRDLKVDEFSSIHAKTKVPGLYTHHTGDEGRLFDDEFHLVELLGQEEHHHEDFRDEFHSVELLGQEEHHDEDLVVEPLGPYRGELYEKNVDDHRLLSIGKLFSFSQH